MNSAEQNGELINVIHSTVVNKLEARLDKNEFKQQYIDMYKDAFADALVELAQQGKIKFTLPSSSEDNV